MTMFRGHPLKPVTTFGGLGDLIIDADTPSAEGPSMPVTAQCHPDANAVTLNASGGQKLRHRITADPGIRFTLGDQAGRMLLSDGSAARERLWPQADDDTTPRPCVHALGIVFDGAQRLVWQVDIVRDNGDLVSEVKHCTYTNSGGTQEYFAALDIFLR